MQTSEISLMIVSFVLHISSCALYVERKHESSILDNNEVFIIWT